MKGEIRRLGKETLVYGLSTILGRLINFLLLPFYTHCLAPAEFGLVAVVFTYLAFFNILYQYGMDQAYLRFAASEEGGDLRKTFSTAFTALMATSALFSGSLILFSGPLLRWAGVSAKFSDLPFLCAGILTMDALATAPLAELRRSHRPWFYVSVKLMGIFLTAALNILFLWKWKQGVSGVFWASWIASAASLLMLAPVVAAFWRPQFSRPLFSTMISFALPYVPSGIASIAVQVIDRPILKALTDDATVGIYQANYRLGIFMMLVVNMFDAAWRPFFLEQAGRPGAPKLFARVTTYFFVISSWIVLALSLFIADIVRIPIFGKPLIHPAYWGGLPIVPVVLIGYLFNGLYYNFMPQVYLPKRTDLLIWVTALGAITNVAANLLLIPPFGMMGAAWATLLAYLAMAVALYAIGNNLYPIPYEKWRLGLASLGMAASWAAAAGAHRMWPFLPKLGWIFLRMGLLAAYPLILYQFKFFDHADTQTELSGFV